LYRNECACVCLFAAHVNVSVIVTVDDQTWTTSSLTVYSCRSIEQYVFFANLQAFASVSFFVMLLITEWLKSCWCN